jgi:hypothetical protein
MPCREDHVIIKLARDFSIFKRRRASIHLAQSSKLTVYPQNWGKD